VELNNQATDAWYEIGREYERRGDFGRAALGYMRAGDNADRGSEPYRKAAEMWRRAGKRAESLYCQGRADYMVKDYAVALPSYLALSREKDEYWRKRGLLGAADCMENLPDKSKLVEFTLRACTDGTAEDYVRIADAYGAVKKYEKRKEFLRKAAEKDPSFTGHMYHQFGIIAEAGGFRDEAEKLFEKAAEADPSVVEYQRKLVDLYLERRGVGDRAQRAVKAAERVVQMAPAYGKDYVRLGLAYRAVNDLPRALQAHQHAVDLDPGYGPAYLELGRLYKEMGDKARGDATLAFYRQYQAFDTEKQNLRSRALSRKNDPRVWEDLGDFSVRTRDLGAAAGFYEKAIQLSAGKGPLREKLARTFGMMGRMEEQENQRRLAAGESPR
jgi:tetratricopeptide (TPR) repeat protein